MDLASCQFPFRWVCLKIEITMVCQFAQVLWRIINSPLQSASPTSLRVSRISITSPNDKLNDLKGAHHHFWTTHWQKLLTETLPRPLPPPQSSPPLLGDAQHLQGGITSGQQLIKLILYSWLMLIDVDWDGSKRIKRTIDFAPCFGEAFVYLQCSWAGWNLV